jgi:hypothetical protein
VGVAAGVIVTTGVDVRVGTGVGEDTYLIIGVIEGIGVFSIEVG